jgi:hypothetical protein
MKASVRLVIKGTWASVEERRGQERGKAENRESEG